MNCSRPMGTISNKELILLCAVKSSNVFSSDVPDVARPGIKHISLNDGEVFRAFYALSFKIKTKMFRAKHADFGFSGVRRHSVYITYMYVQRY